MKEQQPAQHSGENPKKNGSRQSIPTLIGKNCLITGNIKGAYAVRIEGVVEGDISETGSLVIGESGKVNGNIHAKTIVVFGHVDGDVIAGESVEIKSSGSISGSVNAQTLSIERGGVYDGKIAMGRMPR